MAKLEFLFNHIFLLLLIHKLPKFWYISWSPFLLFSLLNDFLSFLWKNFVDLKLMLLLLLNIFLLYKTSILLKQVWVADWDDFFLFGGYHILVTKNYFLDYFREFDSIWLVRNLKGFDRWRLAALGQDPGIAESYTLVVHAWSPILNLRIHGFTSSKRTIWAGKHDFLLPKTII